MAISRLRAANKPVKPRQSVLKRAQRSQPRHYGDLTTLTAAALHDIRLHTQPLYLEAQSLQGAAMSVTKPNAQDVRRLVQPWQAQAMAYYDLVPEVKFAATFMSQMLRRVRMFPAFIDPKTHEPQEIDNGPVFDAFEKIQDRSGGREELQANYGKLKFLIGEGYLTVSPDDDFEEIWEFLSPNELRVQPGGIASRFRAPMLSADQYMIGVDEYVVGNDKETVAANNGEVIGPAFTDHGPDIIIVYRLWRASPAYSWLADCNMRAALDILEELVLSTYSVRAQLKSRMYQGGIFFIPDEISFASLGNDPEEDATSDVFQARLGEAMAAAIRDPGNSDAMMPILARVAAEFCDKPKLQKFNDNMGELAEITQRTEMIGRFATCIELPKEVVTGTADINHWGSWLIDEQTWKSYGYPAALEMASDICAAYLQPAAREAGVPNWQEVVIGIDPSEVINHPDRAKDADALYNGRAISKKVWRESKGYNDNDAMPEDEVNELLGAQIRDGSLAVYGIPSVRANIEPAEGDIESATGEVQGTDVAPSSGADIEKGAPTKGAPTAVADQGAPALAASAAIGREQRILGAADAVILRAREQAGSKLRSLTGPRGSRCQECQEKIDGVPNWSVAPALGAAFVRDLLANPLFKSRVNSNLVDGTSQAFAALVERMGISSEWASVLGDLVEQHAARTLFDSEPDPMPEKFVELLGRTHRPLQRT